MEWTENWVSFLDTLLQFLILSQPNCGLYLPTRLQRALIHPQTLLKFASSHKETVQQHGLSVYNYKNLNVVKCCGVELRGVKVSLAPRRQQGSRVQAPPMLEEYNLIPYFDKETSSDIHSAVAVKACVDIAIENTNTLKFKVTEIVKKSENTIAEEVHHIAMSQPMLQDDLTVLTLNSEVKGLEGLQKADIKVVGKDDVVDLVPDATSHLVVIHDEALLKNVEQLKEGAFVLVQLSKGKSTGIDASRLWNTVACKTSHDKELTLLRKVNYYTWNGSAEDEC